MRPILVGMNNPQGNTPLVPYPKGCTGYRIWEMLNEKTGCYRIDYMNSFERINLVSLPAWCARQARANAEAIRAILEGRTAVLLGRAVPAALGLGQTPWMVSGWLGKGGVYYSVPHPSGLNRWYNTATNRDEVASLLSELYTEYRSSAGLPLHSGSNRCEA